MAVNSATGSTLTYDSNGNMTSDGTNAFAWDAENRMIKITYPGSNNFSIFIYDGLSRNVSIVETTAGSVTSTKQFVWSMDKQRQYQACEERDGSGALTKKFFDRGQMNVTTNYFYALDHLSSVREMTDNSGTIQARYSFDPYGRITKLSETIASDFGYGGYYVHSRSGLNITKTRAYSDSAGRFINRDSIEEEGGLNLYAYVFNNPVGMTDVDGTQAAFIFQQLPAGWQYIVGAVASAATAFSWWHNAKQGPGIINTIRANALNLVPKRGCFEQLKADKKACRCEHNDNKLLHGDQYADWVKGECDAVAYAKYYACLAAKLAGG
ncbi:hypothetical protein BH10CYA1_BH10CYA1_61860 [soil metagenome]